MCMSGPMSLKAIIKLESSPKNVRLRPIADIPLAGQNARMTAARPFLVEALQHVARGGDIGEAELDAAVPDPFALDAREKDAWEELSHWADDDDIRERDASYTASKRERMRDHLQALRTNGS